VDEREGRTHGTPTHECAYAPGYTPERERRAALADFLNYCNHERPDAALGGRPPISRTSGSDYRVVFDEPPELLDAVPQKPRSRTPWIQPHEMAQLGHRLALRRGMPP
jgi:hypothetical protein